MDEINTIRQRLTNPAEPFLVFESRDRFCPNKSWRTSCENFLGQQISTTIKQLAMRLQMNEYTHFQHELYLKKGDPVMILRNINKEDDCVNGALGYFDYYEKSTNSIYVRDWNNPQRLWAIRQVPEYFKIKSQRTGYVSKVVRYQFPVRLAYAITVHKVQGASLDEAHVILEGMFERGQAYVAVSRVKTLGGLTIHGFTMDAFIPNDEAAEALSQLEPVPGMPPFVI